jgi:hypothetical protein
MSLQKQELEKKTYGTIRELIVNNEEIKFSDIYDLFFNKSSGIIKNIDDEKNIENLRSLIYSLYLDDDANIQILFGKLFPHYLKYYNDPYLE